MNFPSDVAKSNAVANQRSFSWHHDDNAIVTQLPKYDKPTNHPTNQTTKLFT